MNFLQIYGASLVVIIFLMTGLWLVSLKLKNSSIVDIFWGSGFVILFWIGFILTPGGFLPRKLLLGAMVTFWGLRLSIHVFLRNHGKPEDFRYQAWRQAAGARWWWLSFFKVFLIQGLLLWIIAVPLIAAQFPGNADRLTAVDILGAVFWLVGFFFETMGDIQLARFKASAGGQGKVLDSGVWRYTRHPNYFGDAAQWWGFFLIAAANGGWWTVYSPILMTYLLVFVSGMALLEKTLSARPSYREYMRRTSAFIPWFPRRRDG